ncbi:MAG TPA: NAD(P)H-dependent oxidoreductase [Bryobacteraceae bacterium]|nr:NAD(P)H-dependent oxidoreductase [Bryobacteraceae bacterium]
MDKPVTILGIAGSLRQGSFNRGLLRAAQQLAPAGVTVEICDIKGIPLYNQDDDGAPPASVTEFKARIRAADAILFATPEYNYSIPGVLKNAIDSASRPYGQSAWEGKSVGVMGASGGLQGTSRAQYHLRQCFVFLDMHPVNRPEVMVSNAAQKFDAGGNLTDEKSREMVGRLVAALADWTRKLK